MVVSVEQPQGPGTRLPHGSQAPRLIVNADDYGYFPEVNRGILEAAEAGAVTATGVLATALPLEEQLSALRGVGAVDFGVHLTLTSGAPLTGDMRKVWGTAFPAEKYRVVAALLTGRLTAETVRQEWEAQILRCLEAGLVLRFLNSHEHLHMLPSLFRATRELARRFGIPHVRFTGPEWKGTESPGAVARNCILAGVSLLNGRRPAGAPALLGVGASGKLTLPYLEKRFAELHAGGVYELMCHPGKGTPREADARLRSYHHWGQELALLKSSEFHELCARTGVALIHYRDLETTRPSRPESGES